MFFTDKEIKDVFDRYKATYNTYDGQQFHFYFTDVFIEFKSYVWEVQKRNLVRNERITIVEYCEVLFLLFKELDKPIPRITQLDVKLTVEAFLKQDMFNDYLTKYDSLEDFFKPLVYCNLFIKPKNNLLAVACICAFIELLFKV